MQKKLQEIKNMEIMIKKTSDLLKNKWEGLSKKNKFYSISKLNKKIILYNKNIVHFTKKKITNVYFSCNN